MDGVEAPGPDPLSNAARAQAEPNQLMKGDHPVLAGGKPRDRQIEGGWVRCVRHTDARGPTPWFAPAARLISLLKKSQFAAFRDAADAADGRHATASAIL